MRAVRRRASAHTHALPVADASSQELKACLRSMHDHCLTELAGAEQSSASTTQIGGSSEELSEMAAQLARLVGSFTV